MNDCRFLLKAALLSLLVGLCVNAHANAELKRDILHRIDQAQAALEKASDAINREKRSYANKIAELEARVSQLREKATGIQRQADEKLLSLQKIQSRLAQWQDQSAYQTHMLQRHGEAVGLIGVQETGSDGPAFSILHASLDQMGRLLQPQWRERQIALPSGQFVPAKLIEVGPVRWFVAPQDNVSGLYSESSDDQFTSAFIFSGAAHDGLTRLLAQGSGIARFDPTLGRALEIEHHRESTWNHLQKGGLWTIPIIFFGIVAFAIATIKAVQLLRLSQPSPTTLSQLETLLRDNSPQSQKRALDMLEGRYKAFRKLVQIVIRHPASQHRDDMLYHHLSQARRGVMRYLDLIALTAAVAPLLGLLGTVSGMIKTFKMLTIFGSGDPAAVSGGISEALITTELGLIVAIPALLINAFLSRRAKSYMHSLEETAVAINNSTTTR